jgi:hypothetical protein
LAYPEANLSPFARLGEFDLCHTQFLLPPSSDLRPLGERLDRACHPKKIRNLDSRERVRGGNSDRIKLALFFRRPIGLFGVKGSLKNER